jgi:CBS domain containing-hemolysin-like protein
MSLFESAAHSRLVVYNDTLDDPEGFVHIRDLLAFMTAKAKVDPEVNAKRKKPFPAGLDLRSGRPRACRCPTPTSCAS